MAILTTDSFFVQGASHKVCEDYALHGDNYIVVSDGCSSSEDTDFGSRFLAKAIASNFKQLKGNTDSKFFIEAVRSSIFTAKAAADALGMKYGCLDATILAAVSDGERVHLFIVGDGYMAISSNIEVTPCTTYYEIDFVSGAPEYLSYTLDYNRHLFYKESFKSDINLINMHSKNGDHSTPLNEFSVVEKDVIKYMSFPVGVINWVALFSDGLGTFRTKDHWEVIENMTALKNLKGECLRRRMKRYIKDLHQEGIVHDDDVSGAIMVFEGEENV